MQYAYPCRLIPDREEGAGFVVTFPDVPAAITGARTRKESLILAEDALVAALSVYVARGDDLPTPSPTADDQDLIAVPPVVAAKLALYTAMREQHLSDAALAGRLGLNESAVQKLVNPDHRSPISHVMKALRAVGRNLVTEDRAA